MGIQIQEALYNQVREIQKSTPRHITIKLPKYQKLKKKFFSQQQEKRNIKYKGSP